MIGERIYSFEVLESTNDYALKNHRHLHDGDVILALEQTRGRGREGRKWYSPKGGLWFSVVFKPRELKDPHFFTKLTAVSIVQVLKEMKVKAYLKWPNDVYYSSKKLGGILTEGIYEGKIPLIIVVGVGMNVNNDLEDSIKDTAISLKEITSREIPIDELLNLILRKMRSNYEKYRLPRGILTRIWKKMLDIKEGNTVKFNGKEAIVEKILPTELVLRTPDGKVRVRSARELYG